MPGQENTYTTNNERTLNAVSNADGTTPVNVYADPVTHRLLVDSTGGGGGGGAVTNAGTFAVQLNASQANTTGSITASGQSVTDSDLVGVGAVTVQLSGTYSGFNGIFETLVTGSTWLPVRAQVIDETAIPSTTTGVLPDNTTIGYNISPLYGNAALRIRSTALVSGTVNVVIAPSAQFGEQSVSSMIYDGTNMANVLAGDTGYNGIVSGGGVKTIPFSTSTPGAQTILANTDVRGYSWIEISYTSVGVGLALTGQFAVASGGTYIGSSSFAPNTTSANTGALGTSVNLFYTSPVRGNFFQIAVSALTSGTFTGTLTLRTFPPSSTATNTLASQSGTWTVGANSGTGAAVPANAFYMALNNSGTLAGWTSLNGAADGTSGTAIASVGGWAFNGTNWDRQRNNSSAVVVAGGTTSTQTGIAFPNYNARGLTLLVNITAGAGTVTVAVNGATTSGYSTNLLTSTALTGTGTTALRIFDGATPAANLVANDKPFRSTTITATVVGSVTYGIDVAYTV